MKIVEEANESSVVGPPKMFKYVPYATIPLVGLGIHDLARANSLWVQNNDFGAEAANSQLVLGELWPYIYLFSGLILLASTVANFWDGRAQWIAMFTAVLVSAARGGDIMQTFGWESRHVASPFFLIALFAAWALVWAPPQRLRWKDPPWVDRHGEEVATLDIERDDPLEDGFGAPYVD